MDLALSFESVGVSEKSSARIAAKRERSQQAELGEYYTPSWAGPVLFNAHLGHLPPGAIIVEPGCGPGRMLQAIPARYRAIGVEINPTQAAEARRRTGREVIVGDIRTVQLPDRIDAFFGNPKFELDLIEDLLARADERMGYGGKLALILPSYLLQTSGTVLRMNRRFTIQSEKLPRDLFQRPLQMKCPIEFVIFTKEQHPRLLGFQLYSELQEISRLEEGAQETLETHIDSTGSVWRALVEKVVRKLGGRAHLRDIYACVEGCRPTRTAWWKQQIRKVCQFFFRRLGRGVYGL
jgi:site-specific DNA-methyltransferase (adenine-specific)